MPIYTTHIADFKQKSTFISIKLKCPRSMPSPIHKYNDIILLYTVQYHYSKGFH